MTAPDDSPAAVLTAAFPEPHDVAQTAPGAWCADLECDCRKWARYTSRDTQQARMVRLAMARYRRTAA
jgi:hypothetical protein